MTGDTGAALGPLLIGVVADLGGWAVAFGTAVVAGVTSGPGCVSRGGARHDDPRSAVMTCLGLEVRELMPSEWAKLRSVRLDALLDSPGAFASTYTRELGWNEHQWLRWFDGARWLVVEDRGRPIGIARVVGGRAPEEDRHHVESIWVRPTHRRHGVFGTLLGRVVDIARGAGQDSVFLWVIGENEVARCAYTSAGFEPTGEEQRLDGDGRYERRWRLDL